MKIMQVPGINGLSKTNGCENAPIAILNALETIYSNEQGKTIKIDKLSKDCIEVKNNNILEDNALIYDEAFKALVKNVNVAFLGGDHSVSYSLVRAFFDVCQSFEKIKEPCLIVFDAHPDLMSVVEERAPTHEEWLRQLIKDGFPAENILLVGVRNSDASELDFIKKNNIKVISMNQFLLDIEDSCDIIMEFVNGRDLYISLDIDVADPAFAPGVGYAEPGGLSSRELVYIFQRLSKINSLKAIDIVEINPSKDINNLTIKLGAKILAELL